MTYLSLHIGLWFVAKGSLGTRYTIIELYGKKAKVVSENGVEKIMDVKALKNSIETVL
jgi:hypothetical protein